MADIYLSYSRRDEKFVRELAAFLQKHGYSVSLLEIGLAAGMELNDILHEELANSKVVLALWSNNSVDSPFVMMEAHRGAEQGKLVSVLLDGVTPDLVPPEFGSLPAERFSDKDAILRSIANLVGTTSPPARRMSRVITPSLAKIGIVPSKNANSALAIEEMINRTSVPRPQVSVEAYGRQIDPPYPHSPGPKYEASEVHGQGAAYQYEGYGARSAQEGEAWWREQGAREFAQRSASRGCGLGFLLISTAVAAVGGIVVAKLFFGRDLLGDLAGLVGLKQNALPAFGALSWRRRDEVECSVFSPPAAPPSSTILVQVFLYMEHQEEKAHAQASLMDAGTSLRGHQPLEINIKRKSPVTISLSGTGVEIDEPQVTVRWLGQPTFGQFEVRLPENCDGRNIILTARVSVDGGLVGCIKFSLLASNQATAPRSVAIGEGRRYSHAFLSYATPDRAEVLKRAQILQATGVSFFQDILTLDPGDRWQPKICEHLDRCDLFLLFWSKAAMDSAPVIQEAERALARQNAGQDIDIVPVILESPPPLPPPPSIAAIHINDKIHHLIAVS